LTFKFIDTSNLLVLASFDLEENFWLSIFNTTIYPYKNYRIKTYG